MATLVMTSVHCARLSRDLQFSAHFQTAPYRSIHVIFCVGDEYVWSGHPAPLWLHMQITSTSSVYLYTHMGLLQF
jgi:hypothetical protein